MGLDADMRCVEFVSTLQFDNEGKRTWKSFNDFTRESIIGWDDEEQIDITEGTVHCQCGSGEEKRSEERRKTY